MRMVATANQHAVARLRMAVVCAIKINLNMLAQLLLTCYRCSAGSWDASSTLGALSASLAVAWTGYR
jgi:hypothetical protein